MGRKGMMVEYSYGVLCTIIGILQLYKQIQ